jgi:hypothetical protein
VIQTFLRHALRDDFFTPTCIREICSSMPTAS